MKGNFYFETRKICRRLATQDRGMQHFLVGDQPVCIHQLHDDALSPFWLSYLEERSANAVDIYHAERPHSSLGMMTPNDFMKQMVDQKMTGT